MTVRFTLSILAVVGLSACAAQGGAMAPFSQASLPDTIQVPAGQRVALETMAWGDITWQCRASKDMAGQFGWAFAGPDAGLKDRRGKVVGRYYGPPATWEAVDDSKVTGTQLAVAPNGTDNIPLQLVKANPAMGMGAMQGVSYIQRVKTMGGVAPQAACDAGTVNQKKIVTYTADYIFWRAM